jgi:hypothetical protein
MKLYDKNKFKHWGIMKKLLIALAIMTVFYSCADTKENTNEQKITNPITRIELSGKNNLVFK